MAPSATDGVNGPILGEDEFGRWVGLTKGDPWRAADGTRSGGFLSSFVVVVPQAAYWTACFHPLDPVVDVDIVLPASWVDDVLEIVDLELDVLRRADGRVQVRDQDEFERTRAAWAMPDDIAARAESTCDRSATWSSDTPSRSARLVSPGSPGSWWTPAQRSHEL